MESKVCTKCGEIKDVTEFFFENKALNKRHGECKICYKEQRKLSYAHHYEKYREHYRERSRIEKMILRTIFRHKVYHYLLEHPCVICGERDPVVLEFDHINPSKKSFGIARSTQNCRTWKKLSEEIQKCQVLCANCHKRRTAIQFEWYKNI